MQLDSQNQEDFRSYVDDADKFVKERTGNFGHVFLYPHGGAGAFTGRFDLSWTREICERINF